MNKISFAITGDSLAVQRLPQDEPGMAEIRRLLEGSDVCFTNLETTIHSFEPDVYPASHSGGDWIVASPGVLADLHRLGFNMMSFANNHTLDWSHGGLLKTIEHLDRQGIVHAGAGANLSEASRPKYLETAGGRVALIAVNSTFRDWHPAGEQRRDVIGRPGLNPLRFQTIHRVTAHQMEVLQELADGSGTAGGTEPQRVLSFGNLLFELGDPGGVYTEVFQEDVKRIEKSIREAVRQADVVLISHHTHEMKGEDKSRLTEFQQQFARICIEAGAHAYIGHGPHVLRGIEMYKGRPIFHGLGDFIFQSPLIEKQPTEFYRLYDLGPEHCTADGFDCLTSQPGVNEQNRDCYESVIVSFDFAEGEITNLVLHPVTLRFEQSRSVRGWPELASCEDSERILARLQQLSLPWGTVLDIHGGVGKINSF